MERLEEFDLVNLSALGANALIDCFLEGNSVMISLTSSELTDGLDLQERSGCCNPENELLCLYFELSNEELLRDGKIYCW